MLTSDSLCEIDTEMPAVGPRRGRPQGHSRPPTGSLRIPVRDRHQNKTLRIRSNCAARLPDSQQSMGHIIGLRQGRMLKTPLHLGQLASSKDCMVPAVAHVNAVRVFFNGRPGLCPDDFVDRIRRMEPMLG